MSILDYVKDKNNFNFMDLTVSQNLVLPKFLVASNKLTKLLTILLACLMLININSVNASTEPPYYTFGVVPQQSASKLTKIWAPILNRIEKDTGIRLVLKTAPNIPEFEHRVSQLQYDFAYMNPYHFTVFNDNQGYQALAKAKDKKIKGIIVVRRDAPIVYLEELEGNELAFPAPAAFAASVLPRATLTKMNIGFTAKYVQTHDSVYINVAQSRFEAGGGIMRTYKSMPNETKDQLRVLWTSPGYTPHAIATRPYLDENIRTTVSQALVSLDQSAEGKEVLSALRIKGFVPAENSDWDDVRGLGLDLLRNLQDE